MSKLKDRVEEFANIAKGLPDNLQAICFELLLRNFLDATPAHPSKDTKVAVEPPPASARPGLDAPPAEPPAKPATKQEDLKDSDLHLKARRFLEKHALSVDQINNLFYKEDGDLKPLFEDLKTSRMAEAQMRIALLQSLKSGLLGGDFVASVETVRQECTARKCYDSANFSANFKNNAALFDFGTWSKDVKSVQLSDAGRKDLAELIKKFQ